LCWLIGFGGAGLVEGENAPEKERSSRETPKSEKGIVIDDFESGPLRWITNDINKQEGHGRVLLCEMFLVRPGAPGGTKQTAATVTFRRAADSWASVSIPIDGVRWREKGVRQISLYCKGDGSDNQVEVVLRGVDSSGEDKKFSTSISLKETDWRRIVLPLSQFTFHGHTADQHLAELYLFQFVKRGSWPSLFFTVDDIMAEWTPTPVTPAPPQQSTLPPSSVRVMAQFDQPSVGSVRVALGANIGAGYHLFLQNKAFRESVRALGARFIRVQASHSLGLTRRAQELAFNTTRLLQLVDAIHSIGAEPLICVDRNPAWQLAEGELLSFCEQLVRSVNAAGRKPVSLWEMLNKPTLGAQAMVIEDAVALYRAMRARALKAGQTISVGGIGLPSPWRPHLQTQLARAENMDFLTYYLYGTHNNSTSNDDLFSAARDGFSVDLPLQIGPAEVRSLVADSPFGEKLPVFITEAAPNSIQDANGKSLDARLTSSYAAAWFARLLCTVAPHIDAVFPYELTSPSWGLLNNEGRAYPAYYSLWMFATYCPRGAAIYPGESDHQNLAALCCKTPTASNVLLINEGEQSLICSVAVSGLKSLRKVRLHLLEDRTPGIQYNELPAKAEQRVTLRRYSLCVLQFIE